MLKFALLSLMTLKYLGMNCFAESGVAVTVPTAENQQNVLSAPLNIATTTMNSKRNNNWWPVNEQEIIQTSPYTPEIQQSIPPTYYVSAVPAPTPAVLSNYRSENWTPYGYPDYGYPVLSPAAANNQVLQVPAKYISIALFIGLLTLFAIIQSSMMNIAKHKKEGAIIDVLSSERRKRDIYSSTDFHHMTPEQQEIFLNDVKIRCIQKIICGENRQLVNDFGMRGTKLAKYLTRSVKKSLVTTSGWDKLVEDAGAAGLRGDDCNVLYRDCEFPAISQIP